MMLTFLLQSFITQDTGDRDYLVRNLRSFDVPILNYVGGNSSDRVPFQISEEVSLIVSIIVDIYVYRIQYFYIIN